MLKKYSCRNMRNDRFKSWKSLLPIVDRVQYVLINITLDWANCFGVTTTRNMELAWAKTPHKP